MSDMASINLLIDIYKKYCNILVYFAIFMYDNIYM